MSLLLAVLLQEPAQGLSEQETRDLGRLVEALEADRVEDREGTRRKIKGFGRRALPFLKDALKKAATPNLRAELVSLVDTLSTVELSAILDRVRAAAEAPGKGAEGEVRELVERLFRKLSSEAERPLDLPTPWEARKVQVSKDARIAHLRDAILLVDGGARISFAQNCIIVATGPVVISHATRVFVVAGPYLSLASVDVRPGEDKKPRAGSLLLSGSRLQVSHAYDTLCGAPKTVRIGHAHRVTTINSAGEYSHSEGCGSISTAGVSLGHPGPNPLEGRLEVTASVSRDEERGHVLVRIPGLPGEYAVREGAGLEDPAGKPFPGTEGWKLLLAEDDFALFGNGKAYAGFPLKK